MIISKKEKEKEKAKEKGLLEMGSYLIRKRKKAGEPLHIIWFTTTFKMAKTKFGFWNPKIVFP